jgi:carboxyl-terminal processing protease
MKKLLQRLSKYSFSYTGRIIIALCLFGAGILFNRLHLEASIPNDNTPRANIDLFWEAWNVLDDRYAFDAPTSEEKIYGAISGLTRAYEDDYTSFHPPREAQFFADTVSGKFGGIGAEVNIQGGLLIIVAPLEGSPSQDAGLKPGDIILGVDERDIVGMTLNEAISYIRGEAGTPVTLTIVREGRDEKFDVTVVRDIVSVPVVDTEVIDGVFVLRLFNFNESSDVEFKRALQSFKRSGSDKLLLDLRNNPGGYLGAAVDIASYFLSQGKVVVSEDFGNSGRESEKYRSVGHDLLDGEEFEMAILVNYGSASASEIVAAALTDHGKATLLGEQTFGKGSVQELVTLDNDTSLKVTIAKWLTPKGNYIDQEGITPKIIIEEDTESEEDLQLQEAVRWFNR